MNLTPEMIVSMPLQITKGQLMVKDSEHSSTQLSALVQEKMEEKNLSIMDISIKLEVTYEHARRIVRGEGVPSKRVLFDLADYLGIPRDTALKLATSDKLTKKYGGIPIELAGGDPSIQPLEREWSKLTDEEKLTIIDMARSMNRRKRGPHK